MKSLIRGLSVAVVALAMVVSVRADEKADIVVTAVKAGQFKTLAKALTEAGLVDTLKGKGPFTVFAPTDEAFEKLEKAKPGTIASLLKDKDALKKVLTYHVVAGNVPAAEAVKLDGKSAKTVQGGEIKVKVDGKTVMINNAKVIKADIECGNGVIHVIDTVLLPK